MRIIVIAIMLFMSLNVIHAESNISNSSVDNSLASEFSDEFSEDSPEVFDPLSGYNRAMTSFNDTVYTDVLEPVAKTYKDAVPQKAREGISNFFTNLMFPIRFINNVLQLKFENAAEELGRFALNTTFGIAGLIDVASMHTDLKAHPEDFGQTLGYYGVPSGPHIVLPIVGPSNLRDFVGTSVDFYADPTFSLEDNWKIPHNLEQSLGLKAVQIVNKISFRLGEYESLRKDAIDLYPLIRDFYEQKRANDIKE